MEKKYLFRLVMYLYRTTTTRNRKGNREALYARRFSKHHKNNPIREKTIQADDFPAYDIKPLTPPISGDDPFPTVRDCIFDFYVDLCAGLVLPAGHRKDHSTLFLNQFRLNKKSQVNLPGSFIYNSGSYFFLRELQPARCPPGLRPGQ